MVFPLMVFPLMVVRSSICNSGLYLKTLHTTRRLDVRYHHVADFCGARTKTTGVNQTIEVRSLPNGEKFYPAICQISDPASQVHSDGK